MLGLNPRPILRRCCKAQGGVCGYSAPACQNLIDAGHGDMQSPSQLVPRDAQRLQILFPRLCRRRCSRTTPAVLSAPRLAPSGKKKKGFGQFAWALSCLCTVKIFLDGLGKSGKLEKNSEPSNVRDAVRCHFKCPWARRLLPPDLGYLIL